MPRPQPDWLRASGPGTSGTGTEGPRAGGHARARAVAAVRQAILSGGIAPGRRLVEEELAADLRVTRASLRAALIELAAEGLVERVPNKGARVRVVSTEEAADITECRMVLEALCAARAAERLTEPQATALSELAGRLERCVADGDPLKYSAADQELHRAVRAMSGQPVAIALLDRLHAQLVRHQFGLASRPERPGRSLGEHLAIIDAIISRDPEAAEKATRRHLASVITALRAADRPSGA